MSWIDNAFGIHAAALSFRSQRSAVLAANIANSDTPDFKARDFNFQDALNTYVKGGVLRLSNTHESHVDAGAGAEYGGLLYRVPTKAAANGNTVESEVEQAAFSDNAVRYQTSLRFLSGSIAGLKLAIKGQ